VVVSIAVTLTFFINFCHWVFQCGCRSLWNGADIACNIHTPDERHCPWCSHGELGYYGVLALMLIPQVLSGIYWIGKPWWMRLAFCLLWFPVAGGLAALAFGWWDGYWTH
jgi:hypothetical protein